VVYMIFVHLDLMEEVVFFLVTYLPHHPFELVFFFLMFCLYIFGSIFVY
jgi:hypothetical protein